MEISAIKEQLAMATVLRHYGLQPDRQHRLLCPFHPDKTPSLQIYPKTNTYCCFSTHCTAGTGDVIQFIQLKENCSKHQAIVKAKELISGGQDPSLSANNMRHRSSNLLCRTEENMDRIAVLNKVFTYFKVSLPRLGKFNYLLVIFRDYWKRMLKKIHPFRMT